MTIKITAKNDKLEGTFLGNITFKKGVAEVKDEVDFKRAIVFAERSGLDWEDLSLVEKEEEPEEDKKDTKAKAKKK